MQKKKEKKILFQNYSNLEVKIFSFEKKNQSMEQKIFIDLYLIIHEEKQSLPFS